MTRPAVYFPTMDTEEVLRYAAQYAETDLEKALEQHLREAYVTEDVDAFKDAVIDVACSMEEVSKVRSSNDLYEAVDKLDKAKG